MKIISKNIGKKRLLCTWNLRVPLHNDSGIQLTGKVNSQRSRPFKKEEHYIQQLNQIFFYIQPLLTAQGLDATSTSPINPPMY